LPVKERETKTYSPAGINSILEILVLNKFTRIGVSSSPTINFHKIDASEYK